MKPASTAPREGGPRTGYASRRPSIAPVGPSHPSSSESPSAPSGASNPGRPMRRSPAGSQPCSPSLSQPLGRDADPEGSGLMRLGKRGHKFKTPDSPPVVANRREFGTCADSLRHHPTDVEPGSNNLTQGPQRVAKTRRLGTATTVPDWKSVEGPCPSARLDIAGLRIGENRRRSSRGG